MIPALLSGDLSSDRAANYHQCSPAAFSAALIERRGILKSWPVSAGTVLRALVQAAKQASRVFAVLFSPSPRASLIHGCNPTMERGEACPEKVSMRFSQ